MPLDQLNVGDYVLLVNKVDKFHRTLYNHESSSKYITALFFKRKIIRKTKTLIIINHNGIERKFKIKDGNCKLGYLDIIVPFCLANQYLIKFTSAEDFDKFIEKREKIIQLKRLIFDPNYINDGCYKFKNLYSLSDDDFNTLCKILLGE